jgi:uridine phosphorylase
MQSHIKIDASQACERVITCGDPARAEWISSLLVDAKPLAKNREYHSYRGKYEGTDIMVISHGVGSAGAAICFKELIECGVKKIIRVGTAGALQKDTPIGAVVVSRGSVRRDGVSEQMIPLNYPAVPNFELTIKLEQALRTKMKPELVRTGITMASDLFYPGLIDDGLKLYSAAKVEAVEMEASTLFVFGSLYDLETAALFALDGNPLYWNQGAYAPGSPAVKEALKFAIDAALHALKK